MAGKLDAWKEVLTALLYPASTTLTDGTEGNAVGVAGKSGIGKATLSLSETASQATSKKMDITVHEVSDNIGTDTLDGDNLVATFPQIVAANGSQLDHAKSIAINFDTLTKPYLQVLLGNTATFAGVACIMLELPNPPNTPVTPLSGTV